MAELVDFKINVPEILALQYSEGRTYPSKLPGAPPQVMFTLVDGRVCFLPEPVAQSIKAAGIGARQPFEIVKIKPARGKVQYQVRNPATAGKAKETPKGGADARPASAPTNVNRYSAAPHDSGKPPAGARLRVALQTAVDAVLVAQNYAKTQGLDLTFTEESIRAIALSVYAGL